MKLARKVRAKAQRHRAEVILLIGVDGSIADNNLDPSSAVLSDAVAGDRRNAGVAPAPLAMWC
jgi:hypothetical protein